MGRADPAGIDLLTPNADELSAAVGRPLLTLGDVVTAAREIIARGVATVLASLGADGLLAVTADRAVFARADAPYVANTAGAGDAALAGFLLGRPPAQWLDEGSFVISKDTGEQYVVMRGGEDPELQRVPNFVSAQLLLGRAELTPYTVRDKYIRTVQLGEDLGIEGAPAGLPAATELVDDGWTACTAADTGIKVAIQQQASVEDLAGSAFLVSHEGQEWLIATAPAVGGATTATTTDLGAYLDATVFAGADAHVISPAADDVAGFTAYLDRYTPGLAIERTAAEVI